VYSLCRQYRAKKEFIEIISTTLTDTSLQKFSLDDISKELQWEEEGKEFWLAGRLYDIVLKKVEKGKIYLFCFNDEREESIVEDYINSVGRNAANSEERQFVNSFLFLVFIQALPPDISQTFFYKENKYRAFCRVPVKEFKESVSPPPRS
jgi:hypothetical protein